MFFRGVRDFNSRDRFIRYLHYTVCDSSVRVAQTLEKLVRLWPADLSVITRCMIIMLNIESPVVLKAQQRALKSFV